jgi:hypothetical protein
MVVCGQTFTEETIKQIQATVDTEPMISRRALSRRVCEWLGWKGLNGQWKEMSCRVALLKLHRADVLSLPEPVAQGVFIRQEREDPSLLGMDSIPCRLQELGNVELLLVRSGDRSASRVWNGLMDAYHYLGAGPLCGAQLRYLLKSSSHGWLGGLAFSAAAWHVAARDEWIGWSEAARRENLSQVVCNSRFLIVPRVAHLASHVLSLAIRRIQRDWVQRYGLAPVLLETYVDRDRFRGTCYRAANWQYVGATQGRGRQDRERSHSVAIKEVYVYPLQRDAREVLCTARQPVVVKGKTQEKFLADHWAKEELGGADFGDWRLSQRLVSLAQDFYARPQASIPQACQSRARTKGAYRFLDHCETSMEGVLAPHWEATLTRIRGERVVLAVQDTTTLNYTAHPAEEMGPIGYQAKKGIGLLLHDTMAFNIQGTPLGLLDVQCWARDPKDFGKKKRRHDLPIEQKESNKWLVSFRKVAEAQKRCPETTLVSVGDREADIYELFALAWQDPGGPKLLVRAEQDRLLEDGQGHLWERVVAEKVWGIQEIWVPRRSNRPGRVARLEIRFAQVSLKPPQRKVELGNWPIWAVWAREVDAPEGAEPLEWMLLTTCEVTTFEQAVEKVAWYTLRWGIETYHRTLKSGCKIEERQLGHADRIETCLGVDMVVAWRIYQLTKLGRETPDVPCTVICEETEWKALVAYVTKNPIPPDHPPTLREFTRMVASLGGFLGRKGDGEPGTQTLWLGLQRLDDLTAMYKVMAATHGSYLQNPPVSSNPGYG